MAVTGRLDLYGNSPGTVWTRLTETALAGSTTIKVQRSNDWKVGDWLVLGPSYNQFSEKEYVQITSINSNLITFSPPLNFTHHGSTSITLDQSFG